MKSNKVFALGAFLFAVGLFIAMTFWNREAPSPTTKVNSELDQLLVKAHSPIKGSPDAKVTIVEFLDPECEACRAMHPILKQLLAEYDGKVRLVIRYMPLHGNSRFAATALEEARAQGKFDEALDALFERQPEWGDHHSPRPELIPTILNEIGVTGIIRETLDAKHGNLVEADHQDGIKAGVRYTPTFFVNGVQLQDIGYGPVKQAIEIALQAQ